MERWRVRVVVKRCVSGFVEKNATEKGVLLKEIGAGFSMVTL